MHMVWLWLHKQHRHLCNVHYDFYADKLHAHISWLYVVWIWMYIEY